MNITVQHIYEKTKTQENTNNVESFKNTCEPFTSTGGFNVNESLIAGGDALRLDVISAAARV